MKRHLLFWVAIIGLYACNNHQATKEIKVNNTVSFNYKDSLDQLLSKEYKKGHLPGFALAVFTTDSIYFSKGYGYADKAQQKRMNDQTVQGIASISKTLIAVSLMKAVEENLMNLDDPINELLPFEVTHPNYKEVPITIRQLATHTSSISDEGNYDKAYIFQELINKKQFPEVWGKYIDIYNANKDMPMKTFLKKVFDKESDWVTDKNFIAAKPGTQYEYSNIGAALLAHCIELKTGKDYRIITKELILQPLQMHRSGWSMDEVDQKNHITYYNEIYNPVPPYHCTTYPDGGLFTSVQDLIKFLQEMMKGYYGKGNLLSTASYQEMMKNQIPELDAPTGIIWDMDNDCCIGHGGNDFGVATMMYFNPDNGIGKILFTNIALEKEELQDQFYTIFNKMFTYDKELEKNL